MIDFLLRLWAAALVVAWVLIAADSHDGWAKAGAALAACVCLAIAASPRWRRD